MSWITSGCCSDHRGARRFTTHDVARAVGTTMENMLRWSQEPEDLHVQPDRARPLKLRKSTCAAEHAKRRSPVDGQPQERRGGRRQFRVAQSNRQDSLEQPSHRPGWRYPITPLSAVPASGRRDKRAPMHSAGSAIHP
jgi:hypothetical protein